MNQAYIKDSTLIHFLPIDNVPGFSHKVIISMLGSLTPVAIDWLSNDRRISKSVAEYYLEKHKAKINL